MKACTVCGIEKPLSEFYFRSDSNKHRSSCKACVSSFVAKKYASNEEVRSAHKVRARIHSLKKYGISQEVFDEV